MKEKNMNYHTINRFLSEKRLSELRHRVVYMNEVASNSYEQVGGGSMTPGLFDDLLHDVRVLRMVRKMMGRDDLLPSISGGLYYPPQTDLPMSVGDDATTYQLILQLSDNEDWALNRFSAKGDIEEEVLRCGDAVLFNSKEVMTGRVVTSITQCQAQVCFVDGDNPNAFLGLNNYSKSSLVEYRRYNES